MSSTWLQLESIAKVLDVFPAVFLVGLVAHGLLGKIGLMRKAGAYLGRPFRGFLYEEDLAEYLADDPRPPAQSWKTVLLAVVAAALASIWIYTAAFDAMSAGGARKDIQLSVVTAATWASLILRLLTNPPTTPPYLLLAFTSIELVSASIHTWNRSPRLTAYLAELVGLAVILVVGATYPLQQVYVGGQVAHVGDVPSDKFTSPEDSVNLGGWLTFNYMRALFKLAGVRTLNADNVWQLSPYFKHKNIFTKYLHLSALDPKQSLLWFLLSSNSLDLITSFSLQLYKAFAGFIPPFCLQRILAALESQDPSRRSEAYLWGLVVFVFHCSFAQLDLIEAWHARRAYERTRGQMFCALHWKSLKRRDMRGRTAPMTTDKSEGTDEKEHTGDIGRVVNLMTGDAYAVAQRFWEFPAVFIAPVRLVVALVFLYNILGWSCFAGVSVVLLAYVLNYPLAMLNVSLTRKSWAAKDLRMSYVNEFFQSIRFLKYMGWESMWANKVRKSRDTELKIRVKQNFVDIAISFIWTWVPSAVILVSFVSFTIIAKEPLTVSKAFTAIEVFSQLQSPMTQLPSQIFALLHAWVSMQRIETFLAEDEVEGWATSLKRDLQRGEADASRKVGFENASFQWYSAGPTSHTTAPSTTPPETESTSGTPHPVFQLEDLTIQFPVGQLSLITGPTGSGKSSLLNALLGEMQCLSGEVFLDKSNHNVAYTAQLPWLEHATIRDNILFRTPFDHARYEAVLDACALKHDLKIFEAGDLTEIGEKGVSLSGGQRARVALARAVYSHAKVVLLDDPLAAVDMHTANHLVQKLLRGPLMKDRTILLVTHHVSLCLPAASYVVELSNGTIRRQGSVAELEEKGQLDDVIAGEDLSRDPKTDPENALPENEADPAAGDAELAKKKAAGKLVEEEYRAEGRVSLRTYLSYMRAVGWLPWGLTCLLILALRGITIGNQFFIARWTQAYSSTPHTSSILHRLSSAISLQIDPFPLKDLPPPSVNVVPWLIIFTAISLTGAVTTITYLSVGYWGSLNASRVLFTAMLDRVSRAPTSFFDRTPIGRILNRFTADIGAVDNALLVSVRSAMSGSISFLASFGVIVAVVPRFAPLALVIAGIYIKLAPPYIKASRDLRRLESVFLSPAFSGFDELLHGLIHVRAFGMEMSFQERFYTVVDKFQGFDHFYWMASFWMKERYDYLGSVIVYLTTLFALWTRVEPGMAALVIVNAGVFAEASRQLVRVFAQLELDFNSIERIGEYLDVEQEAPTKSSKPPPAYWPSSNGGIVVEDLVVKYAPTLPTVLKKVSFEVRPREKVGVVGRTGSGKSTLALSLLRIVEPTEGRIILDGIDISTLGLDDLRGNITIVSQDVALFSGTVRSNLDPFDQHSDEECWNVLERCHLVSHTPYRTPEPSQTPPTRRAVVSSLSQPVSPSGSSFSAGERQLLALARAMLRNARFTILDEASSAIDLETDDKIQRTIREEMADSLVITIAHRLKTVIDYDRILVLDMGEVVEYDTPTALLQREGGVFRSMCEHSADWGEIQEMAASSRKD